MNMQVVKNSVVTLDYSVTDPDGTLVDAGHEPLVYLHGGYDDIFPMIEEAVQEAKKHQESTDKDEIEAAAKALMEAIQPIGAKMYEEAAKEENSEVGMQFEGVPNGDDEDDILIYRVTEIADDKVVLDGNHPLAGMALVFTCTVTAVRPASADEIEHGHIHDADCEHDD